MGSFPSVPGVGQNLAQLWGGQGFGGLGSPGAVPPPNAPGSMPGTYLPVTGPQNMQPANPGAMGIDPSGQFNYAAPGTTGGPQRTIGPGGQRPDIWSRLMNAVGQSNLPRMPGTTFGAPAGAAGATGTLPPPPPMMPMGQGPAPPAVGAFRGFQQPGGAGGASNQGLMAQYMALQQLMRGS
jgi:hypothetical protein